MYIPVRIGNIYSERLTAQLTSECRTTAYVENIIFPSHQWEEIDGINLVCCSVTKYEVRNKIFVFGIPSESRWDGFQCL